MTRAVRDERGRLVSGEAWTLSRLEGEVAALNQLLRRGVWDTTTGEPPDPDERIWRDDDRAARLLAEVADAFERLRQHVEVTHARSFRKLGLAVLGRREGAAAKRACEEIGHAIVPLLWLPDARTCGRCGGFFYGEVVR